MQKPMTRDEKLDEAEWLMSFGEHQEYIAAALGMTANGIYHAARVKGRDTVREYFRAYSRWDTRPDNRGKRNHHGAKAA